MNCRSRSAHGTELSSPPASPPERQGSAREALGEGETPWRAPLGQGKGVRYSGQGTRTNGDFMQFHLTYEGPLYEELGGGLAIVPCLTGPPP